MRKPWFLFFVLFVLIGAACGGDDGGESAGTTEPGDEVEEETTDTTDAEDEVEVEDDGESVASAAFLRAAADRTVDAGTGQMEMVIELTGIPGAPGPVEMTATGSFDNEHQLASMAMDMSALFDQVGGTAEERAQFEQIFAGGRLEIVAQGTTLYMRMPFLAQMFGSDKQWISMDLTAMGGAGAGAIPGLGSAGAGNPAAMLESLRGVSDDIVEVGSEDVRGVATTHLRGTLDTQKALEQVPEAQRAQVEQALSQLGGGRAIPYDVFVDDDGLVRRFAIDLSDIIGEAGGAAAAGAAGSITLDFFEFGAPVEIVVPPAGEVFDATEEMASFAGAAAQG
ncbi:MAG: hypothetical protein ACRDJP_03160 [Actinomycetota bacterium]